MGVDGLRLDAVPYLYAREGTTCENLPETFEFLRQLRRHIDDRFEGRMLLAEANQWPEDAVRYMGKDGEICQMAFHFPLMPRMFMAARQEDRYPMVDILAEMPATPPDCQWALFLRNHDELTLEMVTDEERDYMYRAYAREPQARINVGIRRRLAPLLGNDRKLIEMMNGLLLSMPGTPIVYYGDEIGMGDNIYLGDRNAVRTPMQWNGDRNAGFSASQSPAAVPARDFGSPIPLAGRQRGGAVPESQFAAVVDEASHRPAPALQGLRARFSRDALPGESQGVRVHSPLRGRAHPVRLQSVAPCAVRRTRSLIAARRRAGRTLRHAGVPTGRGPALLHHARTARVLLVLARMRPRRTVAGPPAVLDRERWDAVFDGPNRRRLESWLPSYLAGRRWFTQKTRSITSATILDTVPIPGSTAPADPSPRRHASTVAHLLLVQVELDFGAPECYLVPVAFLDGQEADDMRKYHPDAVLADVRTDEADGVLVDGVHAPRFVTGNDGRPGAAAGPAGTATANSAVSRRRGCAGSKAVSGVTARRHVISGEQSNSSVLLDEQAVVKFIRRFEEGVNPAVELGRFLSERARFPHAPRAGGSIEYRSRSNEIPSGTVAILEQFVPNEGDGWHYLVDALAHGLEDALASSDLSLAGLVCGRWESGRRVRRGNVRPSLRRAPPGVGIAARASDGRAPRGIDVGSRRSRISRPSR